MKKQEESKLAVKPEASIAAQGKVVRGFEAEIDKSDIIIPRAKLIQKMSVEFGEGVKEGAIINSVTKEILPSIFTPIFIYKEFVRFDDNKTMLWKSTDPKDPRVIKEAAFGENGEAPLAMTTLNFFSMFDGLPMPVIVSFGKSSYKTGKQLLSLARFSGQDMFARKYTLGSKKVDNPKGSFCIFTVNPAGFVTEADYIIANQLWETYSSKAADLKVHDETVAGDDVPSSWK